MLTAESSGTTRVPSPTTMSGQIGNFVAGAAEVRAPCTDGHGKTRGFGDAGAVGRPAEAVLPEAHRGALELRLPPHSYSSIPRLPAGSTKQVQLHGAIDFSALIP